MNCHYILSFCVSPIFVRLGEDLASVAPANRSFSSLMNQTHTNPLIDRL